MALTEKQLEQIRERNARQVAEQGLPEVPEDPAVLAKVARLAARSTPTPEHAHDDRRRR